MVRAPEISDARDLCAALVAGGIHVVELTYTTPDLPKHLERAASTAAETGAVVGAGTVQTGAHAQEAIDSGAQFLVTPGQGPEAGAIAEAARAAGIPVVLGAFTPSEVMTALALGSDAVKIFPAHHLGPKYFKDLNGPVPRRSADPLRRRQRRQRSRLPRGRRPRGQRRYGRGLPR